MRTLSTTVFVFILLLSTVSLWPKNEAQAYKTYRGSPIETLFDNQVFAPGATATTTAVYPVGEAEKFGLDWHLSDATPSLQIEVLQCNKEDGTFTKWASPSTIAGTTANTSFTLLTQDGGSDVKMHPSGFAQYKATNTDNTTVTATVRAFHQ